jgi:hypothetical protein
MTTDTGDELNCGTGRCLESPGISSSLETGWIYISIRIYLEQSEYIEDKSLLGNSKYCYQIVNTSVGYGTYLIGCKNYIVYQSEIESRSMFSIYVQGTDGWRGFHLYRLVQILRHFSLSPMLEI